MNRIETYRHGGDPLGEFQRYSIEPHPYIDFSTNINPLGPPPILQNQWNDLFNLVNRYPSVDGDGIRTYYTDKYDCNPASVFPANGASEALYILLRALSPKHAVVFSPSYHDYSQAAILNGATITSIELSPENNFNYPAESQIAECLAECLADADSIIIGHPNNPTGTNMERITILALAESFPKIWFIIDESFSGFMPYSQEQSLFYTDNRPENIIIVQSLTKYYALPGLRLGACIASPDVIRRLEPYGIPWRVNAIADSIAPTLSQCEEYDRVTAHNTATANVLIYSRNSTILRG